jgi:peptidoglycan/LPS O-acetylase OafA/YrhL
LKTLRLPLSIIILVFLFTAHTFDTHRLFSYGLPAFLLVCVILQFEPVIASQRPLLKYYYKLLGDMSYAIYLSHPFVLWFLYRIGGLAQLSFGLQGIVMIVTVTCVGYLIWTIFERPLGSWIKSFRGMTKRDLD